MLAQSLRVDSRWKRIAAACFAVVVAATGYGNAAPEPKPAEPARVVPAKPALEKPAPAKPAPAAEVTATTHVTPPPPPPPVSADALALQYQRVGHELADLLAKRGVGHALDQCVDLDHEFRTIKIIEALATPESRIAAAATLTELHDRIVRWRGIQIARECMDNPLAKVCQ